MISVVIPTYKRPDLLARLLESIAGQSLPPNEVIVVDDASEMDEAYDACIESFRDRIPNLIYRRLLRNVGAPHCRNVGLREATGEWVALVDDDDEWVLGKLEAQWAIACHALPSLGLIYTWSRAQGANGQSSYVSSHTVNGDARAAILRTNFILSASVVVRRTAALKAGLFDERLPSCQDWDMWARIFLAGYDCACVPEILTIYHRHGGNSIGLSPNASQGYKLFLEKHALAILQHTGPVNILKKAWLYVKVAGAVRVKA